jgi:hypothetical protein
MTDIHILIGYVQSYVVNGPVWMLQQLYVHCKPVAVIVESGLTSYFGFFRHLDSSHVDLTPPNINGYLNRNFQLICIKTTFIYRNMAVEGLTQPRLSQGRRVLNTIAGKIKNMTSDPIRSTPNSGCQFGRTN